MLTVINQIRNWLYEKNFFKIQRMPVPIVSIGNLTMGGTGKTPMIDEFCRIALEIGIRPGVVSRGYGSAATRPVKVQPHLKQATGVYGDEPVMLARRLPTVPVYVGNRKTEVARKLISEEKPDIVFADDAFQHRKLFRDLDVVLIDATAPLRDYQNFPWGRARESLTALERAQFIVFTKVNLVNSFQLNSFLKWKDEVVLRGSGQRSLLANYRLGSVRSLSGEAVLLSAPCSVFAVSAIAQPQTFLASLRNDKRFELKGFKNFNDHYQFQKIDLLEVEHSCAKQGITHVVVTEKDAVKISEFKNDLRLEWLQLALHIEWQENDREKIKDAIRSLTV